MKKTLWILGLLACSSFAAEGLTSAESFNPKIDSWVEGVVMSVNADSGKFAVRGIKSDYATLYADMLREIDTKTANLSDDARKIKVAGIRLSYNERFATAKASDAATDRRESDFTFYLPEKGSRLVVVNEADRYSRPEPDPAVKLSDAERRALQELKDLKVGERVVVGFDGGLAFNSAYTLMRVEARPVPASFRTETAPAAPSIASNDLAAPSKADLETTRLIRESITTDTGLSELARSVVVSTLQGHVTLKGTVANADEKRIVFNKAAARVGDSKVTNELEVNSKP